MRDSSTAARSSSDLIAHDRFNGVPRERRARIAPLGFHIILRLEDDRTIATTAPALRTVARVVLEQGEARGLLAFGTADNHVHAALATDAATAGAFARYVETALRWQLRLGARFDRARIRPLHDQRHAYSTFHYAHRQDSRHELELDRTRDGTSLPDLLGLRALDTSLITRVRTLLPRVRREDLVAHFPQCVFDENASLDIDVLAESAAAALALPHVFSRTVDAWRARRAAVHAANRKVPTRILADALRIGVRAVQEMGTQSEEHVLVRAVQKQALLRMAMRAKTDAQQ